MDLARNPGFKDFLLRPEAGDVFCKKEVTWEGRELSYFFFLRFIYLFDRQRSQVGREADREEEEAGSLLSREPNGGCGARFQDPGIMT